MPYRFHDLRGWLSQYRRHGKNRIAFLFGSFFFSFVYPAWHAFDEKERREYYLFERILFPSYFFVEVPWIRKLICPLLRWKAGIIRLLDFCVCTFRNMVSVLFVEERCLLEQQ